MFRSCQPRVLTASCDPSFTSQIGNIECNSDVFCQGMIPSPLNPLSSKAPTLPGPPGPPAPTPVLTAHPLLAQGAGPGPVSRTAEGQEGS